MKHPRRWDLPKGHVDDGETNMECALRELEEETGIEKRHLNIDEEFRYKDKYVIQSKKNSKKKTLIIYLAELIEDVTITPTEHEGFEWVDWNPPHAIQEKTIDPLLREVANHWSRRTDFTVETALPSSVNLESRQNTQ